jgi:hypothetical protein
MAATFEMTTMGGQHKEGIPNSIQIPASTTRGAKFLLVQIHETVSAFLSLFFLAGEYIRS